MQKHRSQFGIDANEAPRSNTYRSPEHSPLHATEEMRDAKTNLEEDGGQPERDLDLLACHGWLSPEGHLYPCGFKQHDLLTSALGFENEVEIEAAGYCKLTMLMWNVHNRYGSMAITTEQWSTIEAWYDRNGFPYAHFNRLATQA
ncbi:MAG: hypothetical protein GKR90_25705 [Pseudomonadales bacterium]|nr:hypothetical protein [Pseudomonadales bacterium]